jgi:hypothetical protein
LSRLRATAGRSSVNAKEPSDRAGEPDRVRLLGLCGIRLIRHFAELHLEAPGESLDESWDETSWTITRKYWATAGEAEVGVLRATT